MLLFLVCCCVGTRVVCRQRRDRLPLALLCGQPKGECRSCALRTPYPHLAAMVDRNVLDDREAKSGAASCARARWVDAVEPFEDAFEVTFWDPDALVGDADLDDVVNEADADRDAGGVRAVVDGVSHQVAKSGDELLFVPED